MTQLRQEYQQFVDAGAEILMTGPDDAKDFQRIWQNEQIPYIGLPDPEHKVLDLYGQEVKLLKMGRLPAQMVIDRQGQIQFVHYSNSMADIPSNAALLDVLKQLQEKSA
jgi:peroxiredoxin